MANILISGVILVFFVPINYAFTTNPDRLQYSSVFAHTTPSGISDLSTLNPDKVTGVKRTDSTKQIMGRAKGEPSGGGGGIGFTIKMDGDGGVTDAQPMTDAPAGDTRVLTIPPIPRGPTTSTPATHPTTMMGMSSTSSRASKSSTGHSRTETTATSTDSSGLSTTGAFMVGLGLGICAFLLFSVLALVLYCRYMQKKTNDYGMVSRTQGSVDLPVGEHSQYMQLDIPMSLTRNNILSGSMDRTYHTYEEAGPSDPHALPPASPAVPSRVPDNRYSIAPNEEVNILSTDGIVAYRSSPSSQVIADTLSRMTMTRAISQHSMVMILDEEEPSPRPRCASVPAIGYEALNVSRRATKIGKDGYAEYIADTKKPDPKSYAQVKSLPHSECYTQLNSRALSGSDTQLNRRPQSGIDQTIGTYAKNKKYRKPDNYTDLIIDQKESGGNSPHNASANNPQSPSADLRTGQNRRLPATPPEETDINAVLQGMSKRQRHASMASMGSICSLGTIPEDDKISLRSENEPREGRTVDRVLSSRSDDSTYTNPNDDNESDDESLNYEQVDPNTVTNEQTSDTTPGGIYLDMDEFYEGDECKLNSDVCLEDRDVFKFDKHTDSSPYYFKVDSPSHASPQKGIQENKKSIESQDDKDACTSPRSDDSQYFQIQTTSPIYTKVDDSASKSAQFEDNNNDDNHDRAPNTIDGYLDMDEFYEGDECKLKSDLCINPDLEDRDVFRFHKHPDSSPYYSKVNDTPYYASPRRRKKSNEIEDSIESHDGHPEETSEERQYFQIEIKSPIYTKVDDSAAESAQCETNNNDAGDFCAEDKIKESDSDDHIYFRVQSLRKKEEKDTNHVLDSKKRSFSEPAYFQLEKPEELCENTTAIENTCSMRDSSVCPIDIKNADKQSEKYEGKYKRKTSLPLPNEMNADYQHLARSVTLPPISESQTYQQLNRGFKK